VTIRISSLAAAAALALTCLTGPAATAAPTKPGTRILLYGDSLTHGSSGDWTYRYRLWQSLSASGAQFDFVGPRNDLYTYLTFALGSQAYRHSQFDRDHAALGGMTFIGGIYQFATLAERYQADVVVAMIGFNDVVVRGRPAEAVADHWRAQVAAARAARPDVDFVVVLLPHTWLAPVVAYNEKLVALAKELNTPESRFITTRAASLNPWTDTYDGRHFSASGERKVATVVHEALGSLDIGDGSRNVTADPSSDVRWAPKPTASISGTSVTVSWPSVTYASSEHVNIVDTTTGEKRVLRFVTGTSATFPGIAGHSYRIQLTPVKGFLAMGTHSSYTEVTIPAS
jgi:lysophospholipase L1-like esterase